MAGQITGAEAVLQALNDGVTIDRVLVDREKDTEDIRRLCQERQIPLEEGSTNDLWRMSAAGHVASNTLTPSTSAESMADRIQELAQFRRGKSPLDLPYRR